MGLFWKSQPVFKKLQIRNLNSNLVCGSRQFSILGQNILWNDQICGRLNQNNTEILADPQEDQMPQTSIKVVAARSKAKAKPRQRIW